MLNKATWIHLNVQTAGFITPEPERAYAALPLFNLPDPG
jgi:hypothetical protein